MLTLVVSEPLILNAQHSKFKMEVQFNLYYDTIIMRLKNILKVGGTMIHQLSGREKISN